MKLLLDTHILLWWLMDEPTLEADARLLIENPKNIIYVSAVSVWEIAIKKSIGKLEAPDDLDKAIETSHFHPLSITMPHAMGIIALPPHHHDPFDRVLISQAKIENCTLVTRDSRIGKYEVPIIWA
jgi:PIN domain nuclease of toxin-antitoxin system